MEANKGAVCDTCVYFDCEYYRCLLSPPQYIAGSPSDCGSWAQPKVTRLDSCGLHPDFFLVNEEPENAD